MKTKSPILPGSDLSLEAYASIIAQCAWINAKADLAAPKAPKGDNTTSTVRPMRGTR